MLSFRYSNGQVAVAEYSRSYNKNNDKTIMIVPMKNSTLLRPTRLSTRLFASSLLTYVAVSGCGDQAEITVQPTLASIQENVFDRSCLECHDHSNPIHGIDLSNGYSLENLLYVQSFMEPSLNLIEAGDPANSLLVRKLRGTAATSAMPLLRPLLPDNRIDAIEEWIANMTPTPQPTLTYLQKNVFDVNCAVSGCHDSASAAQGLNLSSGHSLVSLFGVPSFQMPEMDLIEPGDPANSYLMHKLQGTGNGSPMPSGQPQLSQENIDAVSAWITSLQGPQPTLAWIQENILNVSCAYSGCHDGPNGDQGLNLTAGYSVADTVNVRSTQITTLDLIEPGNADASYFMRKLEGANIIGARMPWLSPALTQEKIDAVRTWIDNMNQSSLEPTLESIQTNVFNMSCALGGCHNSTSMMFGLDLSDGTSLGALVNVPSIQIPSLKLIEPGDPDNSYIIRKLEGTGSGSPMPAGGRPQLSQNDINIIKQWITGL